MAENNQDRRSPIGLQRLVLWPITTDTAEGITYGTAYEVAKVLMSAKNTPSTQNASQDADDQTVEDITVTTGGQLEIGLTAVNSEDRTMFYGNKVDNGTTVVNKDDIAPSVAVAYMTMRADQKVNLYKFPKVSFSPTEESFTTKSKSGINFAVVNMQGNYIPTLANGNAQYVRYGVDPVTDAALITEWFTTGDAYKPVVQA